MDINSILNNIELVSGLNMEDMPEIDLYMDQVIQLFESKLSPVKRNDEEKILTKTMINNYAKGKLLLPINNKKYSKEHLILMSFIYNLKGALSISDIKLSLDNMIKEHSEKGGYSLRALYGAFLEVGAENIIDFKEEIQEKADKVERILADKENLHSEYEEKFILLCSLVNMSNMYRRVSEKLIDEFFAEVKGE